VVGSLLALEMAQMQGLGFKDVAYVYVRSVSNGGVLCC
jgi:hypothetical protein